MAQTVIMRNNGQAQSQTETSLVLFFVRKYSINYDILVVQEITTVFVNILWKQSKMEDLLGDRNFYVEQQKLIRNLCIEEEVF